MSECAERDSYNSMLTFLIPLVAELNERLGRLKDSEQQMVQLKDTWQVVLKPPNLRVMVKIAGRRNLTCFVQEKYEELKRVHTQHQELVCFCSLCLLL